MPLSVQTQPLVPKQQPYPPGLASAADAVQRAGGPIAEELAAGLRNADASLNLLHRTLRQQSPVVNKIAVVDSTGKVIAAIGDFIFGGVPATNYFSELHAGDPLNTGDPSQALFNANTDGSVTIGQHGWLDVLDPYGADAAWIGTQFDTLVVTGAADNGAGLIRLEVIGHTLATSDVVQVLKVVGVTSATNGTSNANGTFTVTKIDANHIDLQNSVFVGAYTSGGTVDRLLHIAGVADNGSGLARIQTAVPHTYESGDRVNLQGVGSGLNTQWTIAVIDSTHFDLVGSTFTGGSNGTSLRYFAGMLAQTFAIGPSFQDYRLRAFADGALRIQNAVIDLSSTAGEIVLDPSVPSIVVTSSTTSEVSSIDPVNGFKQTDGTVTFQALSGIAVVNNATHFSRVIQGGVNVGSVVTGNVHAQMSIDAGSGGGSVVVNTSSGAYKAGLEVNGGHGALFIDGPGTQVVGPRLAAITAPTINTTAIPQTAGATYTVNEQAMLTSLKAAVNQLNTNVTNLQSAVNTIISRLQTHGLTS